MLDKIAQDPAVLAENSGPLKVREATKEIVNRKTRTFLKVLAAEYAGKHGLNPTVVIFDELHAQPNRRLWDVMTFCAGSSRNEPLCWVITTAGDDPDRASIGWEQHDYARKIISGEIDDPTYWARIYGAPENADIYDEAVWRACNPNIGVSVKIETIRAEALKAKESLAAEKNFRWLRLNQWVKIKELSWLPVEFYERSVSKTILYAEAFEKLAGLRCYVGNDLSSVSDLTAIGLVFPPQEWLKKYVFLTIQFIPEVRLNERVKTDHVPYDDWVQQKYVDMTTGDVIDYEFIEERIALIDKTFNVPGFGGDPWGAEKLRQTLLDEHDIEQLEVRQNIATLSPAMKEVERLLGTSGGEAEAEFIGNPCTRWAFTNVRLVTDGNENYKPKKVSKTERMDAMYAIFDAMALCLKMEPDYAETSTEVVVI
jgi:phage terminase large subunit-like protein